MVGLPTQVTISCQAELGVGLGALKVKVGVSWYLLGQWT